MTWCCQGELAQPAARRKKRATDLMRCTLPNDGLSKPASRRTNGGIMLRSAGQCKLRVRLRLRSLGRFRGWRTTLASGKFRGLTKERILLKPNLSRRQFLAHSAGLAGASLGIGMPRPARQGAAEVRVGIIGLGDRGRTLLGALGSLQRDDAGPRVRVVAISDASVQALRRARVALQD